MKLYFEEMTIDPANWSMDGRGEDLFFLSNGHISPLYSVLSRRGYFLVEELATFRKLNSRPGPSGHEEGLDIRVAAAPGQGSACLWCSPGQEAEWRRPRVYSLHGDGELQEGQIWGPHCMLRRWTTRSAS